MSDQNQPGMPGDPFPGDPFGAPGKPIILGEREVGYTGGEMHALLAPLFGLPAEQIRAITIIADTDEGICFGGSRGREVAKMTLVNAVVSGVLET
jgi:hypothetical protein